MAAAEDRRFAALDDWVEGMIATGKLAHAQTTVFKSGTLLHTNRQGVMDIAGDVPLCDDAIFRSYSMTKPVTAVAMMSLVEAGLCALDDPLARFIPAFAATRVYRGGGIDDLTLEPPDTPLTIRHLLTHTGGLTYANQKVEPIATLYRENKVDFSAARDDFAALVDTVAGLPLVFHPGARWHYSISHDVLGRLIEVISGRRFDEFLAERIFRPLGMVDTGFCIPLRSITGCRRSTAMTSRGPCGISATIRRRASSGAARCSRVVAAWSRPRPTICASPVCC